MEQFRVISAALENIVGVIGVHNRNTNQAFTEGQGMLPERDFGKK
jgi:hypothetical protein